MKRVFIFLLKKIQDEIGECRPNMCMESENLKPGWRVRVWKPHEKLRLWTIWKSMKNRKFDQKKHVHGDWQPKPAWRVKIFKTFKWRNIHENLCIINSTPLCECADIKPNKPASMESKLENNLTAECKFNMGLESVSHTIAWRMLSTSPPPALPPP